MRAVGSLSGRKQLVAAVAAAGLLAAIFVPFQSAQAAAVDFTTNGNQLEGNTFVVSGFGLPITIEIVLSPGESLDSDLPVSITPGLPSSGGSGGIIDLKTATFTPDSGTPAALFHSITVNEDFEAYGYATTTGFIGPMTITIDAVLRTALLYQGPPTTPVAQTLTVDINEVDHEVTFNIVGQATAPPGAGTGTGGAGSGSGRSVSLTWPPADTLPDSYFEENPLDKVQINSFAFLDADSANVTEAQAGQQIVISASFTNYQQKSQPYALIIQVTDENDAVVDLMWQIGSLGPGSTTDVSNSWTPPAPGIYKVTVYVWDGVGSSPTPLSVVAVKNIEVN